MASPTKTLDQYITMVNKDFFNIRNVSSIGTFDDFEYLKFISIEEYLSILMENATLVSLTDSERARYRFKPKTLSKFLYDTENLYYLILLMNSLTVETFDTDKLYLMNASDRTKIESIINLEKTLKNI